MKVALSAGHGKKEGVAGIIVYDPGAVYYGMAEHDVCLEIVEMVSSLCNHIPNLELVLIPPDTLHEKVAHVNASGADCAFEVHLNSATDTRVRGTEVLHFPGSSKGFKIATELSKWLSDFIGSPNRGPKPRSDPYFLKRTKCPAVIVEAEFLSNENVARELSEGFLKQKIAYALAYFLFLLSKEGV
ncbi:MAG: hypothetical protein DRO04_03080 [Candidatus Iainarchaeum archaeon]|uniref:MurNAc-LAA domain-containing protein n=1 Tax=Candidatus Iainarchaeum sp. TaxID=3101447 RepID=A0A497JFU9_9ARCH|nr:MAG: hypothetical protein DRO04_03080 [Candidatus Diapherotrites archaeon]